MQFTFYIDTKHTIWYRQQLNIEADSAEAANQLAFQTKNALYSPELPIPVGVDVLGAEEIPETLEDMTLQMNLGNRTLELIRDDRPDTTNGEGEILIYDNLQGLIKQ